MIDSNEDDHSHPFRRDTERGVIAGVCAGLAGSFRCPVWLTRLVALALGWLFPVYAVLVYGVAALILPRQSLRYRGKGDERSFWQSQRHRSES